MKLCIDCKHFIGHPESKHNYAQCRRALSSEFSKAVPVVGINGAREMIGGDDHVHIYCSVERGAGGENDCGPDAKFFEPKATDGTPSAS